MRGTAPAAFDAAFNALELGDASQSWSRLLRDIGASALVPWKQLVLWFDPTPHRLLEIPPARAFAAYDRIEALRARLARVAAAAHPQDPLAVREALVGARGQALMQALGGLLVCHAAKLPAPRTPTAAFIANELRRFEAEVSAVWHARNRPSEYFRVRTALLELARRLDRLALGLPVPRHRASPPA